MDSLEKKISQKSPLQTLILDTKTDNSRLTFLVPKLQKSPLFDVKAFSALETTFEDDMLSQDLYIMHWHTYRYQTNGDDLLSEIRLKELISQIQKTNSNAEFIIFSSQFGNINENISKAAIQRFDEQFKNVDNIARLDFQYSPNSNQQTRVLLEILDFAVVKYFDTGN